MKFIGKAASLYSAKTLRIVMDKSVESSLTVDDDEVTIDQWTDVKVTGELRHFFSTDRDVEKWTPATDSKLFNCRFPYIFRHPQTKEYFCFGQRGSSASLDIFCWKSNDKIAWGLINNGEPVLRVNSDPDDVWHNIWNVAVTVDGNGRFHLLAETNPEGINQKGCGLGYAWADITGNLLDFNPNKTITQVIPYGGNPWMQYIPERNAIIAVHGMIHDPESIIPNTKNYWYITASLVSLTDDLKQKSSWHTKRELFSVGASGVHVADPALTALPSGKSSMMIFLFSYDQRAIYRVSSDDTIMKLFDILSDIPNQARLESVKTKL